LVALLNSHDHAHHWMVQQLRDIAPPMVTCEAVLAEASYLTRELPGARAALMEMLGEEFLRIGMALADHHSAILAMIRRYADVPMSLADACVVRLAELHPQSPVLTLDSDFLVYRKNGRQVIEVLRP
jgi:predicted nucleic acid-binding protein